MNPTVKAMLDHIDTINDPRTLAQFENAIRNDPMLEGEEVDAILRRIASRETLVKGREKEDQDFSWQERLAAMAEALRNASTKGSGIKITQRISNGKRVPLKGGGFDVPTSGSGDSEGNDPYRAGLSDFVEQFIRPHLSEGYITAGKKSGGGGQLISGNELVDKEGVVPPDAALLGLNAMLERMADTGSSPDELSGFAAQHNLSKAILSKARGIARKRAQAQKQAGAQQKPEKVQKEVAEVLTPRQRESKERGRALSEMSAAEKKRKEMQARYEAEGKVFPLAAGMGYVPAGGRDDQEQPLSAGDKDLEHVMKEGRANLYSQFANDRLKEQASPDFTGNRYDTKGYWEEAREHVSRDRRFATNESEKKQAAEDKRRVQAENRQHRDEGSVLREEGRDQKAADKHTVFGENRQRRDEGKLAQEARQQAKEDRADELADKQAKFDAGLISTDDFHAFLNDKASDLDTPMRERRVLNRKITRLGFKTSEQQKRQEEKDAKEAARMQADAKRQQDAVMEARYKSGILSDAGYEQYLNQKAVAPDATATDKVAATRRLGSLGAKRQTKEAQEKGRKEREAKQAQAKLDREEARKKAADEKEAAKSPSEKFREDRTRRLRQVDDEFLRDEDLRKKWGTRAHDKARYEALKAAGLDTAADKTTLKGQGGGGLNMYKGGLLVGGVFASARAGLQAGNAVGTLASGLMAGVTGAAGAFVAVGTSMLGLVLSPFGKAGAGIARLGSGLAGSLLASLSAGGALITVGVKLAGGIAGGLLGAGAGIIGGALGAVIGAGIGGVGALAGAAAGAFLASQVVSGIASVMSSLGGALGQFFGAIGAAVKQLGGAIGDTLSSVKDILSDLIETGKKFSAAAISVSRTGNLSLGAGAQVGALGSVLTGDPNGLASIFSGFAEMSQFRGSRLQAFGVPGATGTDPLGDTLKSAEAFRRMDAIRGQLLLNGGFNNSPEVGNLFTANKYSPGLAAEAIGVARKTALTPGEAVQNYRLSLHLEEIQTQLDRLKTRLLSDLMPVLSLGVNAFGRWFTQNEKSLTQGMETFGRWMMTQFPGYLRQGINVFFELGKSVAGSLPVIAEFGKSVYATFAAITNSLKPLLEFAITLAAATGVMSKKDAGKALRAVVNAKPIDPQGMNSFFDGLAAKSPGFLKGINDAQGATNKFLDGAGVKNMNRTGFDTYMKNSQGSNQLNVRATVDVNSQVAFDMDKLQQTTTSHIARQLIMAEMRTA